MHEWKWRLCQSLNEIERVGKTFDQNTKRVEHTKGLSFAILFQQGLRSNSAEIKRSL